jgi:excisionase family DNA binding protein
MADQKLLNIKEVAEKLRVSQRTIMRYISSKKLRATKVGQWRITQNDLDFFLKSHTNK